MGVVVDARGFVIPAAIGNDICCGMRLLATDVTAEELEPYLDALGHRLRAIFFQGQRNIPMSPQAARGSPSGWIVGTARHPGGQRGNGPLALLRFQAAGR